MQMKGKMRRGSRKILTIALLPILIFIWMTGWILVHIGRKLDFQKNSEKKLEPQFQFEKLVEKSEMSDEESRTANEPRIVT